LGKPTIEDLWNSCFKERKKKKNNQEQNKMNKLGAAIEGMHFGPSHSWKFYQWHLYQASSIKSKTVFSKTKLWWSLSSEVWTEQFFWESISLVCKSYQTVALNGDLNLL
jgi:hypothetical protein